MSVEIRVCIYSSHLDVGEGADWESLQDAVLAALRDAFPKADRSVEVKHRVSGAGAGTRYMVDGREMDGTREDSLAQSIVAEAVERWVHEQVES
jgi:hypothetical protein